MSASEECSGLFKSAVEKSLDGEFARREEELDEKLRQEAAETVIDPADLYQDGLDFINSPDSPVFVKFDLINGNFLNHSIYIKDKPQSINGVSYTKTHHGWKNFRPLRRLNSGKDLKKLKEVIWSINLSHNPYINEKFQTFWIDLTAPNHPKITSKQLYFYVQTQILIEKDNLRHARKAPRHRQHSFDNSSPNPLSWIPCREAFSPAIQKLTLAHIFPLFPPAELGLFELWLGRVGVGPANTIPDGKEEEIFHTARTGIVILGKEAGLGKSYQLNKLRDAMQKVGMTMESIRSTNDRFDTARFLTADIAFKDDTSRKSLSELVSSDNTKIMISNDELVSEQKYRDAVPVFATCAFCINANEIDMNTIYELDPGIVDRVRILNTKGRDRLKRALPELYPDPNRRPPTLEPAVYLPWLAESIDCDVEALMLWALRLGTDKFWSYVKDGDMVNLREKTHALANRCEERFLPNLRLTLMKAFLVSMLFTHQNLTHIPELNIRMLEKSLYSYVKLQGGRVNLSKPLKADWEADKRNPLNPWQAFRDIYLPSVKEAAQHLQVTMTHNVHQPMKINEIVNESLAYIYTRNGQKANGGYTYLKEAWDQARQQFDTLSALVTKIKQTLTKEQLDYLHDDTIPLDNLLDWTNNDSYSPDIAENLRPTL